MEINLNKIRAIAQNLLAKFIEAQTKPRDDFIANWRNYEWPEHFDKDTAQIIADAYKQKFADKRDDQNEC